MGKLSCNLTNNYRRAKGDDTGDPSLKPRHWIQSAPGCFNTTRTLPDTTNRLFRQLEQSKTKIDRLMLGESSRS